MLLENRLRWPVVRYNNQGSVVAIFTNVAALPLRSVTVLVVTGCGFVENPPLMCIFPNSNATGLKVAKHIFPMASPTNAATAV